MKNLLLLNSSIVVNKPIFSKDLIKIEYGSNRIDSYVNGFINLKNLNIFELFEKTILIDNTVSSIKKIPNKIIETMPSNTLFLLDKNNKLGRANKGAGMLRSLQDNISMLRGFDLIFYFEPRLLLKSSDFIKNFLEDNVNYFSIESEKRVKTGYFGTTSFNLINFLELYSPEELVEHNLHIELLMYEFYENKNTNFQDTSISLWKNYLSGIYEEY